MRQHRRPRHGVNAQRPSTFARVRALLAGALVLGVGATATLAAWTDQEHATATITAGMFAIQSKTLSDADWVDRTNGGGTLTLNAGGLYPGQSVAAPFQVRTVGGSVAGSVSLTSVTNGEAGVPAENPHLQLWNDLEVRIGTVSDISSCKVAFTSATLVTGKLNAVVAPGLIGLGADSSSIVTYCIEVSLPLSASNAAQGGSVTPTWTFTGSTS